MQEGSGKQADMNCQFLSTEFKCRLDPKISSSKSIAISFEKIDGLPDPVFVADLSRIISLLCNIVPSSCAIFRVFCRDENKTIYFFYWDQNSDNFIFSAEGTSC